LESDHLCAFVRHCLPFGGGSEETNAEMPRLSAVCAAATASNIFIARPDFRAAIDELPGG
jgi:hypothetical protein